MILLSLRLEQCCQSLGILKRVCSELGIPLAPEKQVRPSAIIEFLSYIIIDTSLCLAADKYNCSTLLRNGSSCKHLQTKSHPSCTKKGLESLLGVTHHKGGKTTGAFCPRPHFVKGPKEASYHSSCPIATFSMHTINRRTKV